MSLNARSRPSWRLSTWWPRHTARNGRRASRSPPPRRRGRRSWCRRCRGGRPDQGPTTTRSYPSRAPSRYASWRTTSVVMPSTPNTCDSMLTKSSSPSSTTTRLPTSDGTGGVPDWSVSQNWLSRWLREPSAMSTSSSRVNASNALRRVRRLVDQPERAEDAGRLGPRLLRLVGRVGVAHERGAGGDLHVAVEVDVGRADEDGRVHDREPVLVAADERGDGRVVAAAVLLVLLDQAARVLDRAAGDGGGEHRVAQHLAHVAARAAGEQVLGVHEVAHRLEVRAEHEAALVADVAHHLELLVDDHEELVDLLLVGEEAQQLALAVGVGVEAAHAERAADGVHPHLAVLDADVPLRARADQVAVAGEDAERPEGAALPLEQPAEHRERPVVAPVGDAGAVVAPDHQVGALAAADLLVDDVPHHVGVVVVGRLEAAAVGELDGRVGQLVEQLVERDVALHGRLDDAERRAVLVRLEPALAGLRERHEHQVVPAARPDPVRSGMSASVSTSVRGPPTSVTVSASRTRISANAG